MGRFGGIPTGTCGDAAGLTDAGGTVELTNAEERRWELKVVGAKKSAAHLVAALSFVVVSWLRRAETILEKTFDSRRCGYRRFVAIGRPS